MSEVQHEAYQPIIEDGRGRFPEDVRFKAPRGLRQAIAKAAELDHTTQAEWTRRALLQSLSARGVKLRRGRLELEDNVDATIR
ncbi:MAG: hypothetical protein WA441_13395 [Methyloceanibacter sp.]